MQWRDNSIRILSIFIALLLWVYVTNEQNPVTDQTFSVPLTVQDAPRGYVLDGMPGTVSVRARGTRVVIGGLRREDFSARVDLSGIESGVQDVRVNVTAPPEVEVLHVTPAVITITADQIEEKSVPVAAVIRGTVSGGMQAGAPEIEPASVNVSGPAGTLNEIKQLSVTVDVTGASETVTREVRLDAGPEGVTVSPERVRVTVPVTGLPSQSLPVRLKLTGAPAGGYEVSDTAVNPQTVTVTARDDVLRGINVVNTMALNISGISADAEREAILVLPNGAHLVEPDRVTVTITVTRVEEEQPPPEDEGENETEPGEGDR